MSVHDAIKFCKAWVIHRKWLSANKVDLTKFDEEKDY